MARGAASPGVPTARQARLDRLEAFADCLLLGLLIAVASLPVLTIAPAFAAGCHIAARWQRRESPRLVPTFLAELRRCLPGGLVFTGVLVSGGGLVAVDLALMKVVPGGGILVVPLLVLAAFGVVVALATCAAVGRAEGTWLTSTRLLARRMAADPRGSALLLFGAAVSAVIVWMLPPLVLVVTGPLALAAVSVPGRAR